MATYYTLGIYDKETQKEIENLKTYRTEKACPFLDSFFNFLAARTDIEHPLHYVAWDKT